MRALTRPLVVGSLAVAALLSSPADAVTRCFGEQSLGAVCVVTPTVSTGEETYCFYVGTSTCKEVTVPTVETSGQVSVYCTGALSCPILNSVL